MSLLRFHSLEIHFTLPKSLHFPMFWGIKEKTEGKQQLMSFPGSNSHPS